MAAARDFPNGTWKSRKKKYDINWLHSRNHEARRSKTRPVGRHEADGCPPKREAMGFFTDSTLCIGCKACEVACKQWNGLPADGMEWTGQSYDNTRTLSATTWRHVTFTEIAGRRRENDECPTASASASQCAIGQLAVQQRRMQALHRGALPAGLPDRRAYPQRVRRRLLAAGRMQRLRLLRVGLPVRRALAQRGGRHSAHKCTLCYDRQKDGIEPACAKACPTDSISFGPVEELRAKGPRAPGRSARESSPKPISTARATRANTSASTPSSCSPRNRPPTTSPKRPPCPQQA